MGVNKQLLQRIIEYRDSKPMNAYCDIILKGKKVGAIPLEPHEIDTIRYYYDNAEERSKQSLADFMQCGPQCCCSQEEYNKLFPGCQDVFSKLLFFLAWDSPSFKGDEFEDLERETMDIDEYEEYCDDFPEDCYCLAEEAMPMWKYSDETMNTLEMPLDSLRRCYEISVVYVNSNGEPSIKYIPLTDDEYIDVIFNLHNHPGCGYDMLVYQGLISKQTDRFIHDMICYCQEQGDKFPSFAIELKELNEDVLTIFGDPKKHRKVLFDSGLDGDTWVWDEFVIDGDTLNIQHHEKNIDGEESYSLEGINVSQLCQLLNVESIDDAFGELKNLGSSFCEMDFYAIKEWMDNNGISYTEN